SLNVLPPDVYLHTLPMFHANGWGGIWALAGRGGTQVCLRQVEAQVIFELMQQEQITLACAAPTVLVTLATFPGAREYRLAPGVRIGTGGGPPPAAGVRQKGGGGGEGNHLHCPTASGASPSPVGRQPARDESAATPRRRP